MKSILVFFDKPFDTTKKRPKYTASDVIFFHYKNYSHSMVAGGLPVMSYTTRLTPFTSFTIRELMRSSTSYGT